MAQLGKDALPRYEKPACAPLVSNGAQADVDWEVGVLMAKLIT